MGYGGLGGKGKGEADAMECIYKLRYARRGGVFRSLPHLLKISQQSPFEIWGYCSKSYRSLFQTIRFPISRAKTCVCFSVRSCQRERGRGQWDMLISSYCFISRATFPSCLVRPYTTTYAQLIVYSTAGIYCVCTSLLGPKKSDFCLFFYIFFRLISPSTQRK